MTDVLNFNKETILQILHGDPGKVLPTETSRLPLKRIEEI
jgi:hypothetical protein